ncbi:MAG: DUF916 domain-containing protein [Anaerolineae bacterium]|nr:DUF916 domain-containing protein [Anaerolineae bacterium]MBT7189568.1 DUF916 domain-containing protein [Anaerolineae bacterium]MBT7992095.1 DUF916 domain-containing protein [Anaerolineae bacterium]
MPNLRSYLKKISFVVVLTILMLALIILPVLAQSSANISFGIRPTKALEGQAETYSYFSFRTSPGSVFNDEALVLNDGGEAVTLKVYAADGITARNGGTDFAKFGEEGDGMSRGTHAWISLPLSELTLAPGEERLIPFQIAIPADASSGYYVAGLVVEAVPEVSAIESVATTTEGEAQFNVEVIRRVGVAVVIDIPGEQSSSLEIENIALYRQDEQGTTFSVDLRNTGSTFLQSKGFFVVTDRNAERIITTIPLEFDTILPGDKVTFYVPRSARFEDGKYLLSVVLDYGGEKAVLEGIGMNIKNGQPEIEGQILDNLFTSEEIEVFFEKEGKGDSFIWTMVAVVSFILALLVGWLVYRSGEKKEKKEVDPIF